MSDHQENPDGLEGADHEHDGFTLGERANMWRRRKNLSTEPAWIMSKAAEELGEVARALVGMHEDRPGRGDVVQEAAQTIIVLASLVDRCFPGRDVLAAVEDEMVRLGAPGRWPARSNLPRSENTATPDATS